MPEQISCNTDLSGDSSLADKKSDNHVKAEAALHLALKACSERPTVGRDHGSKPNRCINSIQ
jgi:hypothetical protein